MNKSEFIKELSKELNFSEDKCIMINDILESNFFISKKNKEKIIKELVLKLNIDLEEADMIYNTSVSIIVRQVKTSLKHPFVSKD